MPAQQTQGIQTSLMDNSFLILLHSWYAVASISDWTFKEQ